MLNFSGNLLLILVLLFSFCFQHHDCYHGNLGLGGSKRVWNLNHRFQTNPHSKTSSTSRSSSSRLYAEIDPSKSSSNEVKKKSGVKPTVVEEFFTTAIEQRLLDNTEEEKNNTRLKERMLRVNEDGYTDREEGNVLFPELQQAGIDEIALRKSPFGKILFGILDTLFPIFKEPNWFDEYDRPLTPEENLELPYFDGYDFVNSSWTIYIRHRYGAWNWLDRMGFVPKPTQRVFLRGDGKTMWSDGFYGEWYINPAINYFQIEKHYGRGYGYSGAFRGIRVYQIQKWNYEEDIGRYWNRGLRSYLRNETNYYAFEGRVWGMGMKWRPYPRDQGKFIAIRDGANLAEVFGGEHNTPWERRFRHSMGLPFYQAHPDQLERIEDNFDMFYRNLLEEEVR